MPARPSQHLARRTAVLVLTLTLAACGSDNPVAPDLPGEESAPLMPELLTAGSGPRILFSSSRTGGTDIYRMAPDGSGVVRVTTFAGAELLPAWSWDNSRIAMVRNRLDASNVVHKDIYLMNADGTGKRWARSTTWPSDLTDPSWSKDGTRLVVSVWIKGSSREVMGTPYLALVNVATGNLSYINAAAGPGLMPSFDPTGKKIVYVGDNGGSLETINADGTGHQTIIGAFRTGLPAGSIGYPIYSPDGKRIAFCISISGNWDIFVRNMTDGTIKRLTTNVGMDIHPAWSSDGTRIAFSSNRTGKSQIWTVPSNGGTQVRITNTSWRETSPAWSH